MNNKQMHILKNKTKQLPPTLTKENQKTFLATLLCVISSTDAFVNFFVVVVN